MVMGPGVRRDDEEFLEPPFINIKFFDSLSPSSKRRLS